MAGRRYSAGRIFLDVVPSFKGVMRNIEREAEKARRQVNDADKEAAERGARQSGEAARKETVKQTKRTHVEVEAEAEGHWRRMTAAERREAVKARRARDANRRLEQKDTLAGETRAENERRKRMAKARRDEAMERIRLEKKTWREINAAIRRSQDQQAKDRKNAIAKSERELSDLILRVQTKRLDEMAAADRKAARDEIGLIKEVGQEFTKASRDRVAEGRKAASDWEKAWDDAIVEVGKNLERQGGRFGQEMRKQIGKALQDLPDAEIGADATGAHREIAEVRRRLETLRNQRLGIDIDAGKARAEIMALERQLDRIGRTAIDIDVRTNAKSASMLLRDMRQEMDRGARASATLADRHRNSRDQALDTANAFRLFNVWILALAIAIPVLIPAIAGLTAVIGGLIPMLLGAASGAGVMIMAFSGIGDAVGALADQQDNAAKDSLAASKTMRNAARQVRDAEQGVERARRDAAQAAEDSARRVAEAQRGVVEAQERGAERIESALRRQEDAERALARAQESAKQAVEDLADARQRAADEAADRELAIRGGRLSERSAELDLSEARKRMLQLRRDPRATPEERERAVIAYERARLSLEEIKRRNAELAEEEAEFKKKGVDGTELVTDAKERLKDAIERVGDAERDATEAAEEVAKVRIEAAKDIAQAESQVADAIRAQERQRQDSAQSILDAQERLGDAQASYQEALQSTGEIGSASMRKLQQAMDNLSPAGQRFAHFLFGLKDSWDELRFAAQEGMLPGVQQFMEDMIETYGPGFLRFVKEMSATLGGLFILMGEVFHGPIMTRFFDMMEEYAGTFTVQIAEILLNLMQMVAGLATAFAPFGKSMGDALVDITAGWAQWADSLRDSAGFEAFLEYARVAGKDVLDMLIALGDALITIGIGLAPYADMLVRALEGFFTWIAEADPDAVGKIATAILTLVIAMQTASAMLSGLSTAKMFFAKSGEGGFAHPVGLLSLVLVSMVGLGAILAQEFEWFRDALAWAGDKAEILIGWLYDLRAELALVLFAVGLGYAAWKTYQVGVMAWAAIVRGATTAQMFFTRQVAIFGITSKIAMGWVFAIVAALVALGAGLVWLYNNSDGFKAFVDSTWGYMRDVAGAVADWFMATVWPGMVAGWEWLASASTTAWNDYIWPALQGMWDLAVLAFNWIVGTGVPLVVTVWQFMGEVFMRIWNDFLWPVLSFFWETGQAVFGWIVNEGAPAVGGAFAALGQFFLDIYEAFFEPVYTRFWNIAQWVWGFLVEHVFPGIGAAFSWLGDTFLRIWDGIIRPTLEILASVLEWLWQEVAMPVFEGIGNALVWAWDHLIAPAFRWIAGAVQTGGDNFEEMLERVDPIFTDLGNAIEWVWENLIEPTFSAISAWIDVLVDAFSIGVEAIGNAWEWLRSFLTDPISAVIRFINDYLIGGINTVLGWVGLDGISEINIPSSLQPGRVSIPGGGGKSKDKRPVAMASGGILPGYSPGVDNFHFKGNAFDLSLAGGEAIMRPEWTAAIGADVIDRWNAAARTGGQAGVRREMGFSSGGIFGGAPRTGGGFWDTVIGVGKGIIDFSRDPLGALTKLFLGSIEKLKDNPFVDFVTAGAKKIAGAAKDKIMDMMGMGPDGLIGEPGPAIPGGMPWQQIWGIVKALNPTAFMTSNKRGNKWTASGYPSYHGIGRAVDFVSPNMGLSWQILANTGIPWTELYYTPKGFIRKGRLVNPNNVAAVTKRNHHDHVHIAYGDGGMIPTASDIIGNYAAGIMGAREDAGFTGEANLGVYDSGGILQPGDLAINLGKTPERITTQAQWSTIENAALRPAPEGIDEERLAEMFAQALTGAEMEAAFDRHSLVLTIAGIQDNEMRRMTR